MTDYIARIDTTVAGIPCQVGVLHYEHQRGSYSRNAPSDIDYYGYTECDWALLDRRGRPAAWLERKLTDADRHRIEAQISEAME